MRTPRYTYNSCALHSPVSAFPLCLSWSAACDCSFTSRCFCAVMYFTFDRTIVGSLSPNARKKSSGQAVRLLDACGIVSAYRQLPSYASCFTDYLSICCICNMLTLTIIQRACANRLVWHRKKPRALALQTREGSFERIRKHDLLASLGERLGADRFNDVPDFVARDMLSRRKARIVRMT